VTSPIKYFRDRIKRLIELGPLGVWTRIKEEPRYWGRLFKHTYRLFMDNRGPYQANALAYRTMVSMVPIFALMVSMMTLIMGQLSAEQLSPETSPKTEMSAPADGSTVSGPVPGSTVSSADISNVMVATEDGATMVPVLVGDTAKNKKGGSPFKKPGIPGVSELGLEGHDIYDDIAANFLETVMPEFPERQDIMAEIKPHVANFVEQARKGAVIGFLILFLASVFLINAIETIFNNIWHVRRRRAWSFRVLAYTALTFLIPVLLGLSIYITALFSADDFLASIAGLEFVRSITPIRWTLEQTTGIISGIGLPVMIVWVLFLAMFKWLPNTKVEARSALFTSFLVAMAFELFKWGFSFFAGRMVASRQIWWGSLGVFLIFLVWVYIIWWIILFGAQLTYVIQNYRYVFRKGHELEGRVGDAYLACRVMLEIGKSHIQGDHVPSVRNLAETIEVEVPRIQNVLEKLMEANLVILGSSSGKFYDEVYVPGRDLGKVTMADVVHTVTDVWRKPATDKDKGEESADIEPGQLAEDPEKIFEAVLDQRLGLINSGLNITFRELLEKEKALYLADSMINGDGQESQGEENAQDSAV